MGIAEVKIIICETTPDLAKLRFAARIMTNRRKKIHGESSTKPMQEKIRLLIENFEPVHVPASTLIVDTTENYNPDLGNIIDFIGQQDRY